MMHRKHVLVWKALLMVTIIFFSTYGPASAMPLLSADPESALPMPIEELEEFIDGIVNAQMSELGVPGVAVSVVRDGHVLLCKGYGFSDVEQQTKVDAESSSFRIGSLSKLFAYTAIMQLVEQGKLSLDDDINTHISDWKVPSSVDNPVRVWHLLTHTSGLKIPVWGKGYRPISLPLIEEVERPDLGAYLKRNLQVVFPPGEMYSYSDTGAVLAGYLVEVVSGLSYPEYIEQNILGPLDMEHTSTVLQPGLVDNLAKSYLSDGQGGFRSYPLLGLSGWPGGSMYATASDMAKFMLFQLGADIGERPVLSQEGLDRLHGRAFQPHPDLPGTSLSFFEYCFWGPRALRHGGGFNEFVSDMLIFPEQNIGVFITTNHKSGGRLAAAVLREFTASYIREAPEQDSKQRTILDSAANELNGRYDELSLLVRAPYALADRVLFDVRGEWQVDSLGDGRVFITPPGAQPQTYALYSDLLARNGEDYMCFLQGTNTTYLLGGIPSQRDLRKLAWFELRSVQRLLWLTTLVLLVTSILGPISLLLVKERYRGREHRSALTVGAVTSIGILLFLVGCAIAMPRIGIVAHPVYYALQLLILLSLLSIVAFLVLVLKQWHKWNVLPRVLSAISVLGFSLFLALAVYWRLFDVSF